MGKLIPLYQRINLDLSTGCWNWKGATYPTGYGTRHYMGRQVSVHRLAAHLWKGMSLDDSRQVMHDCDNRLCFNPKHLKLGTQLDNEMDKISRGRHHYAKRTQCKHGHEFSSENTKISEGQARVCLTCVANRNRERADGLFAIGLTSKGTPRIRRPYKNVSERVIRLMK